MWPTELGGLPTHHDLMGGVNGLGPQGNRVRIADQFAGARSPRRVGRAGNGHICGLRLGDVDDDTGDVVRCPFGSSQFDQPLHRALWIV